MKKLLLLLLATTLLACGGAKNTEKALNTGNYDVVIAKALNKLRSNKNSKKKQNYVIMLEKAFAKAAARDENAVAFLKKENNPAKLEKVYKTYVQLKNRQERIRPILPLYRIDKGKDAVFNFKNYDNEIIANRNKLSEYLYTNASQALQSSASKHDYRKVYEDLIYIDKINPGFKNTSTLIQEAHNKGLDFVKVEMKNNSDKVIPKKLEEELLNIDTYGLDNLWTIYHPNPQPGVNYDYTMLLDLNSINITPEKVTERQLQREKVIVDGWKYLTNKEGEVVKNEKGEKIKVDKKKTVTCEYYEFTQFKAVNVSGNVKFTNNKTKQLVENFPIGSEFVFEHVYANYTGDKRALTDDLVRYLGLQAVSFPTNEQMVYDSGEDLKAKLKAILQKQVF